MSKAHAEQVLSALRKFWLNDSAQGQRMIAVSGGVDSMVLLEGLHRISLGQEKRARLQVLHVNHALRGSESDADQALVEARARQLEIPVRAFRLDWAGATASQDKCRQAREKIFRELCRDPSDRVFLAHHLNDQAETLFLRIIRGTGAKGLAGMRAVSGIKLRPFLELEKQVLLQAAAYWNVPWREDRSNEDTTHYDRNWLRHAILPLIEERRPGLANRLAGLAQEAQGWKTPVNPLPVFSWRKGVAFAKPPQEISSLALREAFAVSRFHCRQLQELLAKSSGCLHAEGVRFSWSAGILLAEKGEAFAPDLQSNHSETWESELGTWKIVGPAASQLVLSGSARGESAKKEFQSLRVPTFFRSAVPLLKTKGRTTALLPVRLESRFAEIHFRPSALASWWLGTA